jgi:hypothetical protein
MACCERPAAIEDPLIAKHEQPSPEASLVHIKLANRPEYVKEYLLHNIFRLGFIAENLVGNPMESCRVPFEKNG